MATSPATLHKLPTSIIYLLRQDLDVSLYATTRVNLIFELRQTHTSLQDYSNLLAVCAKVDVHVESFHVQPTTSQLEIKLSLPLYETSRANNGKSILFDWSRSMGLDTFSPTKSNMSTANPLSLLDTDTPLPYPATTKTATTPISEIPTTATLTSFADKLLLTITQHGKLAQWFTVPLGAENPSISEGFMSLSVGARGGEGYENTDGYAEDDENGVATADDDANGLARILIPQNRFVAKTLLGGGGTEREVFGGFLSRCVAGLIVGRTQSEDRVLVVGLGLVGLNVGNGGDDEQREVVLRVLELVSRVL